MRIISSDELAPNWLHIKLNSFITFVIDFLFFFILKEKISIKILITMKKISYNEILSPFEHSHRTIVWPTFLQTKAKPHDVIPHGI